MKIMIEIDATEAAQWDVQAMGHQVAYAIKNAALGLPYARERGIGEAWRAGEPMIAPRQGIDGHHKVRA